jgi:hypothetical protein
MAGAVFLSETGLPLEIHRNWLAGDELLRR